MKKSHFFFFSHRVLGARCRPGKETEESDDLARHVKTIECNVISSCIFYAKYSCVNSLKINKLNLSIKLIVVKCRRENGYLKTGSFVLSNSF